MRDEVNLLDLPCAACQRGEHEDCDNGYPDLGFPECRCEVCERTIPYWTCPYPARWENRPGHDPHATCT